MTEKQEWEEIAKDINSDHGFITCKMKVDAGYIYKNLVWNDTTPTQSESMCFVRDAPGQDNPKTFQAYMTELEKNDARIDNLLNKVAELSMKLNVMQSSLRELDKYISDIEKVKLFNNIVKPPCDHDWDTSKILTSNPPKMRCKKCYEYKRLDSYNKPMLQGNDQC